MANSVPDPNLNFAHEPEKCGPAVAAIKFDHLPIGIVRTRVFHAALADRPQGRTALPLQANVDATVNQSVTPRSAVGVQRAGPKLQRRLEPARHRCRIRRHET